MGGMTRNKLNYHCAGPLHVTEHHRHTGLVKEVMMIDGL